jgi:hypothetical protein
MKNEHYATQFSAMRELVMAEWDPIGVRGTLEAEDEYDAYIPGILRLISSQATVEELFAYLWQLETDSMGLGGNEAACRRFAGCLASRRGVVL